MTVRELMAALLSEPMDATVYVGKGMGPLRSVDHVVTDRIYVIVSPKEAEEARRDLPD